MAAARQGRHAAGGQFGPCGARRLAGPSAAALTRRDALLSALLDGVLPAACLQRAAPPRQRRGGERGPPHRRARLRSRRHTRAAAHGQLGPGRRLGGDRDAYALHHGRRTSQTGESLRPVRRLPGEPGHGGAAARWLVRVRHAGAQAACGRLRLPGRRPRSVRRRGRGQVLRPGHPDARRPRTAGPADRGAAVAGDALVRSAAADEGQSPRAGPGPGDRGAQGAGRGHDTDSRRHLRRGHRRAPAGLAYAPALLARRPGAPREVSPAGKAPSAGAAPGTGERGPG